jgi:glycosyltransferase involved in cell wall biosynthesis
MHPAVSVVIPARNEGDIHPLCLRISTALPGCEIIVIVDTPDDTTRPHTVSKLPPGPANAIQCGVIWARGDIVVIMCADGSDDPAVLPAMVRAGADGAAVASASRYAAGGARVGGPRWKAAASRLAGRALAAAGAGTSDPTNVYKAYDADFLYQAGLESRHGFTMGIEMVAKARRLGKPVAEIPVVWRERTEGRSNFKARWVFAYLRWWWFALGPPEHYAD